MKKTLYIMVGAPASGKSWFATNKLLNGLTDKCLYVSRDSIRNAILKNEDEHFSQEKRVYKQFISIIISGLNNSSITHVIADATHLNWPSRWKLMNAIDIEYDIDSLIIIPVVINSKAEIMKERNRQREGRGNVSEEIIDSMLNSMTSPKLDPFKYDAIMEVDN